MKSYIFIKKQDSEVIEGCAWVGSNNISRAALMEAHEWCLRQDFELPYDSTAAIEFANIRKQFSTIMGFTMNL